MGVQVLGERAKRELLLDYARRFGTKVFVETGTYKGQTVKAMLKSGLFDHIYSMEIYKDRYKSAFIRFAMFPSVDCLLGDSGELMPGVLSHIDEPALFWLDAHHSGKQIARKKGLIETPIVAELKAILTHKWAPNHVILIDDARYYEEFGNKYDNYPTTDDLIDLVHSKFPTWVFENKDDIIRCHHVGD